LERYAQAGVENILALGGDPPRGITGYDASKDAFAHAADLVRFIRQYPRPPGSRGFGIGVAGFPEGHPATPNRMVEMDYLKAKVDAGADYICTQLFFDNRDFFDFCERCEIARITVPIIAGVMPITTLSGMQRMSELALGARIPGKLQSRLYAVKDDPTAVERVGIEWAAEQCRDLLANKARGIHFYTLNKSGATLEIYKSLGLGR
jgi:methylenetetrahydrofolate reductase (NADPH)